MAATHPWISKWPENLDFSKQSVPAPGTPRPGQTSENLRFPENLPADAVFSIQGAYRGSASTSFHSCAKLNPEFPAPFPYFTLADIELEHYRTLPQIFDSGLQIAGPQAPFLGHRPVESHEPLKFANHYLWQTWGEIDTRRRNVGSALQGLFASGAAVGTNGLDTVGIWSANTPGTLPRIHWRQPCDFRQPFCPVDCRPHSYFSPSPQNGR